MSVTLTVGQDGLIHVKFPYDRKKVQQLKEIKGRSWVAEAKHWSIPFSEENMVRLRSIFDTENVMLDDTLAKMYDPGFNNDQDMILKSLKDEMQLKGYSWRTQKSYISHARCFLSYYKKSHGDLNETDVRKYLLFLMETKQNSHAFVNQAHSAIKFLFQFVLLKENAIINVSRCKKEKKLPIVLS